jgi:hypothetical protein
MVLQLKFVLPLKIAIFAAGILSSPCSSETVTRLVVGSFQVTHTLATTDGDTLRGRVIEIENGEVVFETRVGVVRVPVSGVRSLTEFDPGNRISMRQGRWRRPNPHRTRLFFAPTGRTLNAGEGYLADHLLFFPALTLGLTDRLTMGGGFSIVPGINLTDQLFFVTPKLGLISSRDINVAVGAFVGGFPGTDEVNGTAGVVYGVGTFGSLDQSVTAGLGFGFLNRDVAEKAIFMLGGEKRVSENISIVSENWHMPGAEAPVLSAGVRMFGEFFSVDLGMMGFPGGDLSTFPYFDVVISFGP